MPELAQLASFALPQTPDRIDGEYVFRSGKLFEAGDYPDKAFSMTPDELASAAAAFEPCDVDLEHTDTVLSGKLGRLESVSLADAGQSLHGVVRLPKWLDDTLGDTERKVSATWDRASKQLQGLALVLNPRVADAALMSAYATFAASRHDTPEGQQIVQELHNTAARGGAVCKSSNTAKMASSHEGTVIQKVHDMTTEHGATCSSKKPGQGNWPYMFSRKEGRTMSRFDEFMAWLKGDEGTGETPITSGGTATMSATDKAEFDAMKKRQDELEAENARIRAERIHDQAVVFADTQIHEHRAFPAEKEAIVTQYVQAATDDTLHGSVSFGEGEQKKTTSRVEMLGASFAARKTHGLTDEQLKDPALSVLMNQSETSTADKPPSSEQVDKYLALTPGGRATIAMRSRTNGKGN